MARSGVVVGMALLGCLAASVVRADEPENQAGLKEVLGRLEKLEAENAALRAEVNRLARQAKEPASDELRALIRELAEKERPAVALMAGYDKNFFLSDAAGRFRLELYGQLQARYTYNYRDGADAVGLDEDEGGFLIRRAKVGVRGHLFDPSLEYNVRGGFERSGGLFRLEDAYLKYRFAPAHYVQFGQYKIPFLREELVSSSRQLAVERSSVAELFTVDFGQGVTVGGQYDLGSGLKWAVSFHDGREQRDTNFDEDATEFAVSGRVEGLLCGDWKQFDDFVAWPGDPLGLLVGLGFDYSQMDSGAGTLSPLRDYVALTADVSLEAHPFNAFLALVTRHGELDGAGGSVDQLGLVAQAGVALVPERFDIFVRGEYIDYDDVGEFGHTAGPLSLVGLKDEIAIYTVGFNYYLKKHSLKLTVDAGWAPDGIRAGESGAGTLTGPEDGQFIGRVQVQVLF